MSQKFQFISVESFTISPVTVSTSLYNEGSAHKWTFGFSLWRACVPSRHPNQMRICSLAQRQSIWFVHLSSIGSCVDAGMPPPRRTTGHVHSLPEGPHWFTKHLLEPVFTENSYTAKIQLDESSGLTGCWLIWLLLIRGWSVCNKWLECLLLLLKWTHFPSPAWNSLNWFVYEMSENAKD